MNLKQSSHIIIIIIIIISIIINVIFTCALQQKYTEIEMIKH